MEIGAGLRAQTGSRVAGWRVWTVVETRAGIRLGSVIYDTVWTPRAAVTATCEGGGVHDAPRLDCGCGFYAAQDPVDAFSYLQGRDEPRTICRVLGEVLLEGGLVETESGYRGAAATPLRLYLDDVVLAAELRAVYGVPVLSAGCKPVLATSSSSASAGSRTSSWSAAPTRSSRTAASG